jgi:hypothetical protein
MLEQIATGGAAGGILALLSHGIQTFTGWLGKREERKTRAMEMDHEAKMFPLRVEAAKEENSWRAFTASIESSKDIPDSTPWWAAAVLTLTRPALTLILGVSAIAISVSDHASTPAADQIREMAFFAFGWWFGCRQLSKGKA